jgi:hypothetical protein
MTEPSRHDHEAELIDELALADSSRPDDPIVAGDEAWRPSPTGVRAYEARLQNLLGAYEALEEDL